MKRTSLYYKKEYVQKERSIADIAEGHQTYPNKIRREIVSYGYKLRDKSEAQKVALKSGRHKHPTKGKARPLEVRTKISESVRETIKNNAKTQKD